MSDWIKHEGGPRPVPADTVVRVQYRHECRADISLYDPANQYLRWNHTGGPADIIAYQIVDPAPPPPPPPSAPPVLMARDDGGPAFPVADMGVHGVYGMSLLDWYAGQVAAGMAAFSGTAGISYGPEEIAGRSYEVAAALVAARSRAHAARNDGDQ